MAEVSPFAIKLFPALGMFIIPASKPNVFELVGFLSVKVIGEFVLGSIIDTVLLKKLLFGRMVVPLAFVALIFVPLISK